MMNIIEKNIIENLINDILYDIMLNFSASDWKAMPGDDWFLFDWESSPLQIKTTSAIGSNDQVFFEVGDANKNHFARVVIRLSSNSIYYVRFCQDDFPLENMPDAPDNVRVWTFTKKGFEGLLIECNGVEVANLKFAESEKPECMSSKWVNTPVKSLHFNQDWDKSVNYRGE